MNFGVRLIDQSLLAEVSAEAKASPRARKNRNFHPSDDYPAHRLLNAIEPGSYIVPHCHVVAEKDETILCLRGRLGLIVFDEAGAIVQKVVLEPAGATLGVDIPHRVYHTALALESGTVFLEAKSGPYVPLGPAEIAAWAPAEGSAEAAVLWAEWRCLF